MHLVWQIGILFIPGMAADAYKRRRIWHLKVVRDTKTPKAL